MKKLFGLVLSLLLALGCTVAPAQGGDAGKALALNPENYPYFYVMGISQAQADASSAIVVNGCFGDFQLSDADGEADLDVSGFDEENPVELSLAEDCVVLMPVDLNENVITNLPCQDILQWFAEQSGGEAEPFTFYAVITLDETNQVTQLAYQYFPWG